MMRFILAVKTVFSCSVIYVILSAESSGGEVKALKNGD